MKNIPIGRCYPASYAYILSYPIRGLMMVHGSVIIEGGKWGEPRFNHAWIEYPNGAIFEPMAQRIYSREQFQKIFTPIVHKRYTRQEAMKLYCKYHHCGPYYD